MQETLTLYQFTISHYCEIARWALDRSRLPYVTENLVPLLHLPVVKRMAPKTSVPVVRDGDTIVQGSAKIIDHLEVRVPTLALTPTDPALAMLAREKTLWADREIGIHLRRYFYYHAFQHRQAVLHMLLQQAPWYGVALFQGAFPLVRQAFFRAMNINESTAAGSRARLETALSALDKELETRDYLVGDSFSRADLSVAALLAHMFRPPQHDLEWLPTQPPPLDEFIAGWDNSRVGVWVREIYAKHRQNPRRA